MHTAVSDQQLAPVPVIDISPFSSDSPKSRQRVADEVSAACEGIGFILVAGHGVPQDLIDRFYEVTQRFFRAPLAEKLAARSPLGSRYVSYARPGSGKGDQPSERQSFNAFRFDTPEDAIARGYPESIRQTMLPVTWPADPEFRQVWREYFEAMEGLASRLLAVFEVALRLPKGWFADKIDRDQSTQAANYYSYDLQPYDPESPLRFKAHVDGSILTILYQDDGPGCLQLHQRRYGWRDVLAIEGTFVVNLGELMARWTNDRFVATPHRVTHPADPAERRPRMSAPFFLKPNVDAVIAPIPELIAPGEKPKYPPVLGGPWVKKSQVDAEEGYDSTARFEELAAADPIYR